MVLMTSGARSREALQFLPWPLEHSLSGHSLTGYSLSESSCYAVTSPQHIEAPHTDTLVNSLAELPANSQHELPPQEGSPWTSFPVMPLERCSSRWQLIAAEWRPQKGTAQTSLLGLLDRKNYKEEKAAVLQCWILGLFITQQQIRGYYLNVVDQESQTSQA